jgi:hypothetical protein
LSNNGHDRHGRTRDRRRQLFSLKTIRACAREGKGQRLEEGRAASDELVDRVHVNSLFLLKSALALH